MKSLIIGLAFLFFGGIAYGEYHDMPSEELLDEIEALKENSVIVYAYPSMRNGVTIFIAVVSFPPEIFVITPIHLIKGEWWWFFKNFLTIFRKDKIIWEKNCKKNNYTPDKG